nr:hypothetical protein [uncultured Prevotella sp.]
MKINFEKIEGKDVNGKVINIDMSKTLGNQMYRTAMSEDDMNLGKEIYIKGTIEVNPRRAASIKRFINEGSFFAFVKCAIIPTLDRIMKESTGIETK